MAKKKIATFLGPNKGLSIAGDYAYAYNNHGMIDTATTILSFVTGNEIIKGKFSFMGPIRFAAAQIASGDVGGCQISMNGQVVAILKSETVQENMPGVTELDVIIPPVTKVECDVINASEEASYIQTLVFTGRIYA